jgi:serine/threonine protein kinase
MPYVVGGNLYDYTRSRGERGRLDATQKTQIAIGVAYGMHCLHNANIIHRDLKSMNILLDTRLLPFICDFGIARTLEENCVLTRNCGTVYWMAPEQMKWDSYDNEVDVYSFGMVLYEMLCERFPFQGDDKFASGDRLIGSQLIPFLGLVVASLIQHLQPPTKIPDPLVKLIEFAFSILGLPYTKESVWRLLKSGGGPGWLLSRNIMWANYSQWTFS